MPCGGGRAAPVNAHNPIDFDQIANNILGNNNNADVNNDDENIPLPDEIVQQFANDDVWLFDDTPPEVPSPVVVPPPPPPPPAPPTHKATMDKKALEKARREKKRIREANRLNFGVNFVNRKTQNHFKSTPKNTNPSG